MSESNVGDITISLAGLTGDAVQIRTCAYSHNDLTQRCSVLGGVCFESFESQRRLASLRLLLRSDRRRAVEFQALGSTDGDGPTIADGGISTKNTAIAVKCLTLPSGLSRPRNASGVWARKDSGDGCSYIISNFDWRTSVGCAKN